MCTTCFHFHRAESSQRQFVHVLMKESSRLLSQIKNGFAEVLAQQPALRKQLSKAADKLAAATSAPDGKQLDDEQANAVAEEALAVLQIMAGTLDSSLGGLAVNEACIDILKHVIAIRTSSAEAQRR